MAEKISVSLDGLKEAANILSKNGEELYNIYQTQIAPVLDSSKECLYVSGVNADSIKSQFNSVYKNLSNYSTQLADVLNNKVIPNYNELANILRSLFNNEFATQFNELMGGMKSSGSLINPTNTGFDYSKAVSK